MFVDSAICRDCNETQLCLLQILEEKMSIHPEDFAKYISHTQEGIAACSLPLKAYGALFYPDVMRYNRVWNTKGLFESDCIPKSVSSTENKFVLRWRGMLHDFMLRLNPQFLCKSFRAFEVDMKTLAGFLVDFAIAAERLLGELLQKADHITENEHAKLEDVFGDLSIKEIKVNQGLSLA